MHEQIKFSQINKYKEMDMKFMYNEQEIYLRYDRKKR